MGMVDASDAVIASTRDASWNFVRRAYAAIAELRGLQLAPHLTAQSATDATDAAPNQSA
jgi:hypothetical protein